MTALQQALAAIAAEPADEIIAAKCRGLLIGYDARWRDVPWETLEIECEYRLPLYNPETRASSRTFETAGKLDGVIRWPESGKTYLKEHKTTSEEIADPNSPYWRRLAVDSQVSHYVLAKWQMAEKLDGTVYDVIKKPTIRPKQINGEPFRTLVQNGTYFGFDVPDKERRALKSEDAALYSLRLARDCIDNPSKYFQRRTIPRLDSDVAEYAQELWDIGQTIIDARRNDRHYRNSAACVQFNTPCEYLDICSGCDSPESDRWERVPNVHPELGIIDGRDVLTNSRAKCFMLCRRKHFYRFELGLRKRDEEEREALQFGSLVHIGLAAWWSFFMKDNSNGNDSSNAAIAVARSAEGLERSDCHERKEPPF